jgi:hypothetical protein
MDKRSAIRKYFARVPKWPIWLAVLFLLSALMTDGAARFAPLLIGVALVAWWISLGTGRPGDQQVDDWLVEDLRSIGSIEGRALAKSGLDRESLVRDSVIVFGPRFRNTGGAKFGFRKGKDMKARFTPIDVSVLNFTEHQLVAYQCSLDFMTGDPRSECVDEYFYNDIVSVSTQTEPQRYSVGELDKELLSRASNLKKAAKKSGMLQVDDAQIFALSSSGGTAVRVVLNAPMVFNSMGGGTVSTEESEKAVQAVRKMVREKKAGALPIRAAV